MGTDFDDFTEKAFHLSKNVSIKAKKNRALLLSIMTLAGFDFYHKEWWHYQLFESKKYPLINKYKLIRKLYYFFNFWNIMLKHIFNSHFKRCC